MVPFGQPAPQVRIRRIPQQRPADGGNGYERGLHLDKGGVRRIGQGTPGRAGIGVGGKGLVDLGHVQPQPAQRAVAFQRGPVGGGPGRGVDGVSRPGCGGFGGQPAQAQGARDLQPRPDDGIVDHHHRDRGARDDVHRMGGAARPRLGHQIEAPVAVDQGANLGFGNADQDDGFGMPDQPDARDPGIGVQGDQRVDRLARIAGGAHEIRRDKGPGDGFAAFQNGGHGEILADRAEGLGPRHQVRGDLIGKKLLQDRLRSRRQGRRHRQAQPAGQGPQKGQKDARQDHDRGPGTGSTIGPRLRPEGGMRAGPRRPPSAS